MQRPGSKAAQEQIKVQALQWSLQLRNWRNVHWEVIVLQLATLNPPQKQNIAKLTSDT